MVSDINSGRGVNEERRSVIRFGFDKYGRWAVVNGGWLFVRLIFVSEILMLSKSSLLIFLHVSVQCVHH